MLLETAREHTAKSFQNRNSPTDRMGKAPQRRLQGGLDGEQEQAGCVHVGISVCPRGREAAS